MEFRKKPVIITAVQFFPESWEEAVAFTHNTGRYNSEHHYLIIPTLEGDMTAQPGDWIIRGIKGEFYPCKPDIFSQTYEPVHPLDYLGEHPASV